MYHLGFLAVSLTMGYCVARLSDVYSLAPAYVISAMVRVRLRIVLSFFFFCNSFLVSSVFRIDLLKGLRQRAPVLCPGAYLHFVTCMFIRT